MHALARLGRGRPAGWAALATLTIVAGYVDLWFGGTDVASVLLSLGYLVFVPIALIARPPESATSMVAPRNGSRQHDTPYAVAGGVALAVFLLYVISLAPTTAMWDTSEYMAAARVLGIPHPPGNPVFVLLAHAFGLLPLPVSYAVRINLLAALTSALSAALWFLVTDRVLQSWLTDRRVRHIAAIVAAFVGATAFTVWNQSVVNEKVYTVAMLGVAVVSWLALRWRDNPESVRTDRLLLVMAYLCGIGYANHPAGFLPLPALGVFILAQRPRTLLRVRLLAAAALSLFVGLTPFLFQPIRSANSPAINGGAPTACRTGPELGCTFSAETWSRLKANINREQYPPHLVTERQAPFEAQMRMWWTYFEQQWLRDAYSEHRTLQQTLAILFLLLGLAGGVVHWQRDRPTFWYVGSLIGSLTVGLVFYLNFKYAPLQSPELGNSVAREVRDRDYFFIWGFSTWGIWVGVALAAMWDRLTRFVAQRGSPRLRDIAGRPTRLAWTLAAPVLLLAIIPLIGNAGQAPRRGQTFTREWAIDVLNSVEPYGILVTNGDNDSFPLWYAQEVEGVRRDVTLALVPYLGTDWYVRGLLTRMPEEYDASRGPAAYRDQTWVRPTTSPLRLTADEADAIPPYSVLNSPQRFEHNGISAVVPPGYLTRDQFVVLRFIKDSFPARPLYFSIGNYGQSLGLGRYIVSQGVAQRLVGAVPESSQAMFTYPGGQVDVTRTLALWREYRGPAAFIRENGWVDNPSVLIPSVYAGTGQLLAAGLAARGDTAQAEQILRTVAAMERASRGQF